MFLARKQLIRDPNQRAAMPPVYRGQLPRTGQSAECLQANLGGFGLDGPRRLVQVEGLPQVDTARTEPSGTEHGLGHAVEDDRMLVWISDFLGNFQGILIVTHR